LLFEIYVLWTKITNNFLKLG